MQRLDDGLNHRWHVAINQFASDYKPHPRFMYEAKNAADEVTRLVYLFQLERTGNLPKVHLQCSHSKPVPIENNYLTCCIGQKTTECPYLLALEEMEVRDPTEIDITKAWTCMAHILRTPANQYDDSTGYILDKSDHMFWDNLHRSLAEGLP